MRYLVTARVKPGRCDALDRAIDDCTLGTGSIAGDEYSRARKDFEMCLPRCKFSAVSKVTNSGCF